MKATFRSIDGYGGRYTISNKGKVFDRKSQRFLKSRMVSKAGNNPVRVCDLCDSEGKRKTVQIHSLVAKYFVKNPNNYTNVWHKDNNRLNNNAWNLIYIDNKLNRHLSCKKQYKGGRRKIVAGKFNAIVFLNNLQNRGIDEDNILKYYETSDLNYVWAVFENNKSKLNKYDSEVVWKAFDYYLDRIDRGLVCNYQAKVLLDCVDFELKKYTCQTGFKEISIAKLNEFDVGLFV